MRPSETTNRLLASYTRLAVARLPSDSQVDPRLTPAMRAALEHQRTYMRAAFTAIDNAPLRPERLLMNQADFDDIAAWGRERVPSVSMGAMVPFDHCPICTRRGGEPTCTHHGMRPGDVPLSRRPAPPAIRGRSSVAVFLDEVSSWPLSQGIEPPYSATYLRHARVPDEERIPDSFGSALTSLSSLASSLFSAPGPSAGVEPRGHGQAQGRARSFRFTAPTTPASQAQAPARPR